jgi:hypothetical protein
MDEGTGVVRRNWFEIVRRTYDRYGWIFVEIRGGRRRVLARSERTYKSKGRVRAAITSLKDVIGDAEVVDATRSGGFVDLPATSFEFTPEALPLVVGEPDRGRRRGSGRRAASRRGSDRAGGSIRLAPKGPGGPGGASADTAPAAEEAAVEEVAVETTGTRRSGRRGTSGTRATETDPDQS